MKAALAKLRRAGACEADIGLVARHHRFDQCAARRLSLITYRENGGNDDAAGDGMPRPKSGARLDVWDSRKKLALLAAWVILQAGRCVEDHRFTPVEAIHRPFR